MTEFICIDPLRSRSNVDPELSAVMRRFAPLQIAPQKLWVAKINLSNKSVAPSFGFDEIRLPDGALMMRITTVRAGATALSYGSGYYFSFYAFNAPTADRLDGGAPMQCIDQFSTTGYMRRQRATSWFYCAGRSQVYFYNESLTSRNLTIEVLTKN